MTQKQQKKLIILKVISRKETFGIMKKNFLKRKLENSFYTVMEDQHPNTELLAAICGAVEKI